MQKHIQRHCDTIPDFIVKQIDLRQVMNLCITVMKRAPVLRKYTEIAIFTETVIIYLTVFYTQII